MVRLYYRILESGERPRVAAHQLVEKVLGIGPSVLQHDRAGRPYTPEGPCISLSHTKEAVAAAIAETAVGVDVEGLRSVHPSLPRRALGAAEYRWYMSRGGRPEDFLTLWTLKESYYKYLGTGLPGIPNGTDFFQGNDQWRLRNAEQRFFVLQKNGLLIALCGDEQQMKQIEVIES